MKKVAHSVIEYGLVVDFLNKNLMGNGKIRGFNLGDFVYFNIILQKIRRINGITYWEKKPIEFPEMQIERCGIVVQIKTVYDGHIEKETDSDGYHATINSYSYFQREKTHKVAVISTSLRCNPVIVPIESISLKSTEIDMDRIVK